MSERLDRGVVCNGSLLSRLRHSDVDSEPFLAVLVQVERYLQDNPGSTGAVYRMSAGATRTRTVRDERILNLFQGRNPLRGAPIYPGDQAIRADGRLTVQLHTLRLRDDDNALIAENVPSAAVWLPADMGLNLLIQGQGNN